MRCFECWSFPFPTLDATVIVLRQKRKHKHPWGVLQCSLSLPKFSTFRMASHMCMYMYVQAVVGKKHIQRFTNEMPVWRPAPSGLWKLQGGCYSSLFLCIKRRTSSPVRRVLRWSVAWTLGSQSHLPRLLPLL